MFDALICHRVLVSREGWIKLCLQVPAFSSG
jgi:hypothetical protein